jgi:hypothetical protein
MLMMACQARSRRLALLLLAAVLAVPAAFGAEDEPDPEAGTHPAAEGVPVPTRPYGFRQLSFDTRYLVRRPAHLSRRDRWTLVAVGATAVGLYVLREDIREWAQDPDHRSSGLEDLLDGARNMGKGAFAPAVALGSYVAWTATREPRERETALLLLESAGLSAVAALAGSFVLAAERPEDGDSMHAFDTDGRGVSLDAALAASVIPPLRRQYLRVRPEDGGWRRAGKRTGTFLLYAGAILTAYQRIYDDKHWAPDAFLGSMTGLGVGTVLCEAHDARRPGRIALVTGGSADGFRVGLRFRLDPARR